MENKKVFKNLEVKEEYLKNILSIFEGYEVEFLANDKYGKHSFDCEWKSTGLKFHMQILDVLESVTKEHVAPDMPNVFILVHSGDDGIVLEKIQSFNSAYGNLVIFDSSEDIQIFSKDIWNLLVYLNSSRGI